MELLYVPSYANCQQNKSSTNKPSGPLHPLPVPDACATSVAINFVGPLPEDDGYNCIITFTCWLNSDVHLVPTRTNITAEELADLFFCHWYCENGLPADIVFDRDKLFMSKFWKVLHRLSGVKLKMSTAYHSQTDGASERTNKTLVQALRYHVTHTQKGWARTLPLVCFNYMNTKNASTSCSPFELLQD